MYYTLGQRGGIGLGGMKGASEGAWFVLHKDVANNRLVVGQDMITHLCKVHSFGVSPLTG